MTTTKTKKLPSRRMGKGNGVIHSVKGTYERPITPLLKWIKAIPLTSECIIVTLGKLQNQVFKPAGVSEVSGYLMFERWTQGRVKSLNEFGRLELVNKTIGTYRFYPVAFKSKPIPTPTPTPKVEGDPKPTTITAAIVQLANDMSELKAGMSAIFEATAQLLEKANKGATKN